MTGVCDDEAGLAVHGNASRRQILNARHLQIITKGYERFTLVRPFVRPGLLFFVSATPLEPRHRIS